MSETCKTTTEQLESKLTEPKQVSGDQGSVTNHDLDKLIELDKYLGSNDAMKDKRKAFAGIFGQRYQPPSALGD